MSLIIVEGNISAGKSTLCKTVQARVAACRVFFEPTLANPYLERFYKEQAKYALRMQLWLLRQRFQTYVAALRHMQQTSSIVLLDRSVFSDWVFAEKNRLDGMIGSVGFAYYEALRAQMLADLPLPAVTLYLQVAPEVCHARVHELRGRDCESGIPLAYLQGLDDCYALFTEEMAKCGSHVLAAGWDTFGDTDMIVAQLKDAVAHAPKANHHSAALQALLSDDAQVMARMEPPKEQGQPWPKEFEEWYREEQRAGGWDPDREASLERIEQAKATPLVDENAIPCN